MRKRSWWQVTIIALILVFGVAYLGLVFKASDTSLTVVPKVQDVDITDVEATLTETKIKELQGYYDNTDIVGVLSIEGLDDFNYPVAQGKDNDYYLSHDYYGNTDTLGSVMLDYRVDFSTSQKLLIFGHSSTKRDTYFNRLENYYDEDFYNSHKFITLDTITGIRKYEIFSVYVETSDFTYMNMNFTSKKDWYEHILKLQDKSDYSTNVTLTEDDEILIMQTCSNNSKYKDYSKKYLLIVSRRVN